MNDIKSFKMISFKDVPRRWCIIYLGMRPENGLSIKFFFVYEISHNVNVQLKIFLVFQRLTMWVFTLALIGSIRLRLSLFRKTEDQHHNSFQPEILIIWMQQKRAVQTEPNQTIKQISYSTIMMVRSMNHQIIY